MVVVVKWSMLVVVVVLAVVVAVWYLLSVYEMTRYYYTALRSVIYYTPGDVTRPELSLDLGNEVNIYSLLKNLEQRIADSRLWKTCEVFKLNDGKTPC